MVTGSEEEVRQEYIALMGQELGSFYHALYEEVVWLHFKWDQYVALFGTEPSRIELLNRAAHNFFMIMHDTLFENIVLHIAKLTDKPEIGSNRNLTLERLPCYLDDKTKQEAMGLLVDEAQESAKCCRDMRNKRIAHIDLDLALSDAVDSLPSASRRQISDAIKKIGDVLNAFYQCFKNTYQIFDLIAVNAGAEDLLYVLHDGIRAGEERRKRLRDGTPLPEDMITVEL